jgi:hypothetical protein
MASSAGQTGYKPSPEAVAILCERLQRMGVSMSEPAARSLLEAVLAVEGSRLDALARGTVQASLEAIRKATDAALQSLTGAPGESRRDYQLSFPPANEPVSASGQRRRVPAPRPAAPVKEERHEDSDEEEPRPVFKRRRGR